MVIKFERTEEEEEEGDLLACLDRWLIRDRVTNDLCHDACTSSFASLSIRLPGFCPTCCVRCRILRLEDPDTDVRINR